MPPADLRRNTRWAGLQTGRPRAGCGHPYSRRLLVLRGPRRQRRDGGGVGRGGRWPKGGPRRALLCGPTSCTPPPRAPAATPRWPRHPGFPSAERVHAHGVPSSSPIAWFAPLRRGRPGRLGRGACGRVVLVVPPAWRHDGGGDGGFLDPNDGTVRHGRLRHRGGHRSARATR